MMTKYVKLAGGAAYLQETFIPLVQKNLEATWVWEQQINQRANQPPEEVAKSASDSLADLGILLTLSIQKKILLH